MGFVGEQFSRPSGILGSVVGRFMARNNAVLNRWAATEAVAAASAPPNHIVEIGSGPGIGTQALLKAAPGARVTAIEPSMPMQRQLRRRNGQALAEGRLQLVTGTLDEATGLAVADLALAVHVLYFWSDPAAELASARELLRPGGLVALGYQLRQHMPAAGQRDFPRSGHHLYDTDKDVAEVATSAGLVPHPVQVLGPVERPTGRLLLATSP